MFPYLVSVYVIGLLIQTFMLSKGYLKLRKLRNELHDIVPQNWQLVFDELLPKLNITKKIKFQLSSHIHVPLVIGYLKPVVLFPVALVSQLDISQVEAILIHELSHIRRNDYLLNLIKTGIETILFFNPFVWLVGRLINIEREHACDDLVVKFTGTPINYAHALLKLEILKDKSSPALAMASTGKNQHLYQRIKRITDMKTNYMNAKQQLLAITLTVATVISLAWVSPEKIKTPPKAVLQTNQEKTTKNSVISTVAEPVCAVSPATPKIVALADTTKKKHKIKIVTVDSDGNKKEYDSIKELPDSLRKEVMVESLFNRVNLKLENLKGIDSLTSISLDYVRSPEFKTLLKLHTDSSVSRVYARINSPEFKARTLSITKDAVELSKKINAEVFKAQQIELRKNGEAVRVMFASPETKKQVEELKQLQKSPEYKKLKEKFDKDLKKLKEKKGIKSDLTFRSTSVYTPEPAYITPF